MNQQLSKIDQVLAANPEMRREAKIEILQSATTNKTAYIDQAGRVQWGEEVTLTPKGLKPIDEFSNPPDAAASQVTPHPHAENMKLYAEDAAEELLSSESACYVDSETSLMRMMELTESNQVGMDEYLTEPAMAELCQDIMLIGLAMSTGNICPYIAGITTVSCEIDYEYST